jgi:hypothetical protein
MSTTIRSGAVFGVGRYGAANYGISNVVFIPDGVSFSSFVGNVTITAVTFDFDSVSKLYDKQRTVYVENRIVSDDRRVYIEKQHRVVYVETRSTSSDRTTSVM